MAPVEESSPSAGASVTQAAPFIVHADTLGLDAGNLGQSRTELGLPEGKRRRVTFANETNSEEVRPSDLNAVPRPSPAHNLTTINVR